MSLSLLHHVHGLIIRSREDHDECMRIFKLIEGHTGWKKIVDKIDEGDEKLFNILIDEVCAILLYVLQQTLNHVRWMLDWQLAGLRTGIA